MMERDVNREYDKRFRRALREAHGLCLVGAIIAFIGFLLPWFSPNLGLIGWYGGWAMVSQDGPRWGLLVVAGYVVMIVGCCTMQRSSPEGAQAMAMVSFVVLFGTALAVGFALARAAGRAIDIGSMSWGIGLVPLLVGLPIMTWGAISAASLWQLARVVLILDQRD